MRRFLTSDRSARTQADENSVAAAGTRAQRRARPEGWAPEPHRRDRLGRIVPAAVAAGVLLMVLTPAHAGAQESWKGRYNAGPERMQVDVKSWGSDCGSRPRTGQIPAPAKPIEVTEKGKQLVIHLPDGKLTTGACWSGNPGVKRKSSSAAGNRWTTRCSTPPGDGRSETSTFSVKGSDTNTLEIVSKSLFDWKLKGSRCVASVNARRVLQRVGSERKAKEPAPMREQARERCTPGTATRVELSPASAGLEAGQMTCFKARVFDAKDCRVPSGRLAWKLVGADADAATLSGRCVRARADAATRRRELTLRVRAKQLGASARIVIRPANLEGITAESPREPEEEVPAGSADEERTDAPAGEAQRVRAVTETPASSDSGLVVWTLGGLVLLGGLVAWRKLRRPPNSLTQAMYATRDEPLTVHRSGPPAAAPVQQTPVVQAQDAAEPDTETVPLVRGAGAAVPHGPPGSKHPDSQFPTALAADASSRSGAATTVDSATVSTDTPAQSADTDHAPTGTAVLVCPTCRRGYQSDLHTCPTDGTRLITYDAYRELGRSEAPDARRACIHCGAVMDPEKRFCGQCGKAQN